MFIYCYFMEFLTYWDTVKQKMFTFYICIIWYLDICNLISRYSHTTYK